MDHLMTWPEAIVTCVAIVAACCILSVFVTGKWPWQKGD